MVYSSDICTLCAWKPCLFCEANKGGLNKGGWWITSPVLDPPGLCYLKFQDGLLLVNGANLCVRVHQSLIWHKRFVWIYHKTLLCWWNQAFSGVQQCAPTMCLFSLRWWPNCACSSLILRTGLATCHSIYFYQSLVRAQAFLFTKVLTFSDVPSWSSFQIQTLKTSLYFCVTHCKVAFLI